MKIIEIVFGAKIAVVSRLEENSGREMLAYGISIHNLFVGIIISRRIEQ